MVNVAEVSLVITLLTDLLAVVEAVEPSAAQNKTVQEIQAAIAAVQALGL
jgi:hypothetical protein